MSFHFNHRSDWRQLRSNQRRDRAGSTGSYMPLNHHQASWTNNGRQFSIRTASCSIPNGYFASFSGSLGPSTFSQSHPPAGVLDTAFAMLDGMLAPPNTDPPVRSSNRHATVEDGEYEGLEHGDPPVGFTEDTSAAFAKAHSRTNSNRKYRKNPATSPCRSGRPSPTSAERRWGSRSQRGRTPSPNTSDSNAQHCKRDDHRDSRNISKLQQNADHQRKIARDARKAQRDAEWNRNVTQEELEAAMEHNQAAERAYNDARDKLRAAEAEARTERYTRRRQSTRDRARIYQPFSSTNIHDFHNFAFADSDEEAVFQPFSTFAPFGQSPSSRFGCSSRVGFDNFISGHMFPNDMPDAIRSFTQYHRFRGVPPGFFGYSPSLDDLPEQRPRSHQRPRHTHRSQHNESPPQFQPPLLNLITSEEATSLFGTYNERWNSLSSTDPNIAWPARGNNANALSARDTIWAPALSSPVSTWSEELVMKANVQAFFLGAVGLLPMYTEVPGTGQVQIGFDKSRASPVQVDMLLSMLKKERIRWHSDRLGRRNMGQAGGEPNLELQRDERARAVFHAVCELLDAAQ